jgi:hypothetical protein
MKIEAKFDLGQIVYFIEYGEISHGTIDSVKISHSNNSSVIRYSLTNCIFTDEVLKDYRLLFDYELFSTREEIENFINRYENEIKIISSNIESNDTQMSNNGENFLPF